MSNNVRDWIVVLLCLLFFRDDVKWDAEQQKHAYESVEKNSALKMAADKVEQLENEADANWNAFYGIHQNKFFKNRHWFVCHN